jgi:predicted nucleic acid-binding protein
MKILLDTSVLVAAMVEGHPAHGVALPWLQRIREQPETGLVAAHSVAELYAVLTTLPIHPRISPAMAQRLIRQNVLESCEIVPLSEEDYVAVIDHLSESGIAGGATYDALILYAALRADADRVLTLNPRDFQRIRPDLADRIQTP